MTYKECYDQSPEVLQKYLTYCKAIKGLSEKTISEYLTTTEYDPKRIAVERNGEIVFKSQYDDVVLQDEDSIEVVSFVGGG